MSFRSVDHSSPVTVTLSKEDSQRILSPKVPAVDLTAFQYDDSSLRASLAHLQAEISLMHKELDKCKSEIAEKSEPRTPDYTWISDHLNDIKEIIKTPRFDSTMSANLWNEDFTRAISEAVPRRIEASPIVFPEHFPYDPFLRITSAISSIGLVTILILLVLQSFYI